MTLAPLPGFSSVQPRTALPTTESPRRKEDAAIKQRFEQMLWAEMLSHAGLEKAFTQGGGEAASAFSRYVVEEIAKDLAAHHPLGLADHVAPPASNNAIEIKDPPK